MNRAIRADERLAWTPFRVAMLLLGVATVAGSIGVCRAQEYLTGIEWQKPPIITPGEKPGDAPSDAVILFDGKNFDAWSGADTWKIEDGVAVVGSNYIETKEKFGDSQLHIEWTAPTPPEGTSQGRGNSGVFFGDYELQVLDSYENETYYDGQAGAIYKQQPPMVNAMRPPGEWNVYDVLWTAPRFNDDGSLKSPAYITVLHNGVVVQNHFELLGNTPFNQPPQYKPPTELPLRLQDHGNPVKFRNIWIREMKPIEGKRTKAAFFRDGDKETPVEGAAPVKGKVSVNGELLRSGFVKFDPDGDQPRVEAKIDGGKFVCKLHRGSYTVTIVAANGAEAPEKYASTEQSGLKVEVGGSDANEFAFDLK
jgi:hypothetical protein